MPMNVSEAEAAPVAVASAPDGHPCHYLGLNLTRALDEQTICIGGLSL